MYTNKFLNLLFLKFQNFSFQNPLKNNLYFFNFFLIKLNNFYRSYKENKFKFKIYKYFKFRQSNSLNKILKYNLNLINKNLINKKNKVKNKYFNNNFFFIFLCINNFNTFTSINFLQNFLTYQFKFIKFNFTINKKFYNKFFYYNNYFPVFKITNFNKKLSYLFFRVENNFLKFINYNLINFYESFLKKKFFLKINFNENCKFLKNQLKYYTFNNFDIFTKDAIKIIFISFKLKDIDLLCNWIKKKMSQIIFKKHKNFLISLQNIFIFFKYQFFYNLNVDGFLLKVKGKLSVAGNAKKRTFFFKIGNVNLSTKKKKLEHKQFIVKSTYGVLGFNLFLSY